MRVEIIWASLTVVGFLLFAVRGFLIWPWRSLRKRYGYQGQNFTGIKCLGEKVYCGVLWRKMETVGANADGLYFYGHMLIGWDEILIPWAELSEFAK